MSEEMERLASSVEAIKREAANVVEEFLFDDFFYNDSDSVPITISVRGRDIPFRVKRGLSSADLAYGKKVGLKVSILPSGKVVQDMDMGVAENGMIARAIKEWPFKNPDGSPVPINLQTVSMLAADVQQALSIKIQQLTQAASEQIDPLGSPSGEVS